jgi:hypothetical protein
MPRLVVRAILRGDVSFSGFPTIWIPTFVHYGIRFVDSIAPKKYIPFFSDLTPEEIQGVAVKAKRSGCSRSLMESTAALDPVLADFIYINDHKLAFAGYREEPLATEIFLNTWHSFSQPEVIEIQEQMARHVAHYDTFVLMPCSRRRPYSDSRTHLRLRESLGRTLTRNGVERVVVTSLGVVPEVFWSHPIVMRYDAGAVDLWRVFQLLRTFFVLNRARHVIDCLSFRPYSEMVRVLADLQIIPEVSRPLRLRWRSFYAKLR